MELYPAIDLLNGQAVRLMQGDFDRVTVYASDAVALARSWSQLSRRLHLVDLEGSRSGGPSQHRLVAEVLRAFGPGGQVGGGVRSLETVAALMAQGAERVVLGTAALHDPALVGAAAERYPGRIVLALDAREGQVLTRGWLDASGVSAVHLLARYADLPLAGVLYTDVERDGTEVGPNLRETLRLAESSSLPVIASGGVGTLEHLRELSATGLIAGAIVGRALHEGRFSLLEALEACGG